MGGHFTSDDSRPRETSWGAHQTNTLYDESAGQPQLYPPTYPEDQYHEQRMVPPARTTDLVGPGYYPPFHGASYSSSPHAPAEKQQLVSRPVHVVAPTPVNLVIQTNFTHVEHNYYYSSQESDTSSGYGSTPPPSTASSTRSSFSFCSAGSPTTPFDQTQEHAVHRTSQGHYLSYPLRHQYDETDARCYQPSPQTGHGASSYHSSADGRVHPHEAYQSRGDRQYPESTDRDRGYESEPESEGEWVPCSVPGYGYYTTPNQAAEMWRYPSWFHPGVAKGGASGADAATNDGTTGLGSVERPTGYNVRSC